MLVRIWLSFSIPCRSILPSLEPLGFRSRLAMPFGWLEGRPLGIALWTNPIMFRGASCL